VPRNTYPINKEKPLRINAGAIRDYRDFLTYLLVGQLLEIIFTFCTVNVG
jgi:hypothetical protein